MLKAERKYLEYNKIYLEKQHSILTCKYINRNLMLVPMVPCNRGKMFFNYLIKKPFVPILYSIHSKDRDSPFCSDFKINMNNSENA